LGIFKMDSQVRAAASAPSELQKQREVSRSLIDWYQKDGRPFLTSHAPDQIAPLDNDVRRIEKLLEVPDRVTACFLGHSGIGKSTLLNALAAGRDYILPSGGIGPLTALATEVTFSPTPKFVVKYHKRARLWRLVFALQRYHEIASGNKPEGAAARIPETELDDEARQDVQVELDASIADGDTHSRLSGYSNVAQQIVTGSQFEKRTLPYLIDALRAACSQESQSKTELSADDLKRIERVKAALVLAESGTPHQRQAEVGSALVSDLRDHAAGFLAPLVEEFHVGWPSALLQSGVTLVDLPGVGISGDTYRQVTQKYIRSDASAVILTVDRSGPTADSVDLLKASGYWDRLVGAADDPASDPCKLFIVVTKVDDVADADFLNWPIEAGPRPPKREIYASLERFPASLNRFCLSGVP
jgi:Dynamin family